jgi:formate-dependent nitrite reductase cytochrome c552 subunit
MSVEVPCHVQGQEALVVDRLATAQDFQRKGRFYVDFVRGGNSTGFHAPQETARMDT